MKKFLTVLLVIAVMFTFSFGSAFAADQTAESKQRLIENAGEYAKANIAETLANAYKVVVKADADDMDYITTAAWEKAAADIEKMIADDIDEEVESYIKGEKATERPANWNMYPTDLDYTAGKLFPDYTSYVALAALLDNDCDYSVEAALAQFEINFEKNLAKYEKVDMDLYSKTQPTSANSYYKQAKAAIELSKDTLTNVYFAANGKLAPLEGWTTVTAIEADEEWYKDAMDGTNEDVVVTGIAKLHKQYWNDDTDLFKGTYAVGDYTTVDSLEDAAALKAAKVAEAKAEIAKNVAAYLSEYKSAEAKAFAAAYTEVYGVLAEVNPDEVMEVLPAFDADKMEEVRLNARTYPIEDAVEIVEDLEIAAERYAAETDAEGVLVRDAEDVADYVEQATIYEYAKATGFVRGIYDAEYTDGPAEFDADDAIEAIVALSVDLDAEYLAFQKEAAKADLKDALKIALVDYYALEDEAVKAAYEKAYAAIDAAKKDSEFVGEDSEIMTALAKELNKIADKDAVKGLFESGAMYKELDKQTDALTDYVTYLNSGLNGASYKNEWTLQGEFVVRDYYIAQGARTVAEMKALTGVVEAVAATLPTVGDIDAAAEAAKAAIKALPDTDDIVVADKAAIVATFELIEDYTDLCYAGGVTADTSIEIEDEIEALVDALNNQSKLAYVKADKNDKAALRAIHSDVDALQVELVDEVEMLTVGDLTYPAGEALAKIKAAELKAVEKAIAKIPVNVSAADEAVVKAAREAYDAYVADWTNKDNGANVTDVNGALYDGFAMADADNYRTLLLAEAVLGLNAPEEVDAAYSVEALKITASSKATKGAITVKWTVEGDTDAVEGYEIWKSTKKNSGYKKAFTATKMSYKNTKGLKKGTRYFYKVRAIAYTAEGEKVKSDWSNKAYRVAK